MAKLEDVNAKLDYVEVTKALIKQAIENKGQAIEESDTFREFVNKISNIKTSSNFIDNGPQINDINYIVGDIITVIEPSDKYEIGDLVFLRLSKSKTMNSNVVYQYVYRIGMARVTYKETVSPTTENISMEIIFIYNRPYPEFISSNANETGLKYTNEITGLSTLNWYSYEYSNLDVTQNDVLNDKKFINSNGVKTGTMANNGQLNYTPSNSPQSIPAGYTSGGTISAMDITSSTVYNESLDLTREILGIE